MARMGVELDFNSELAYVRQASMIMVQESSPVNEILYIFITMHSKDMLFKVIKSWPFLVRVSAL